MSDSNETNKVSPDTKAGLEKALENRATREELVDRNILPDTHIAPSLMAARKELERSRLEDSLEGKLKNRPDPETLVKEGILNGEHALWGLFQFH
ncbi:hypothetical protein FRC17_001588 [Serendipita sp. 399]|nr:hypothetical protein FRC17_001588 [Serendipita sp. 399]